MKPNGLFDLTPSTPDNNESISYKRMGSHLGKKKFHQFINEVRKEMGLKLDSIYFSWVIIEVSAVDNTEHVEVSIDPNVFLPIAGKQLPTLERHANDFDMSLVGFVDSLNFILNDSRIYNN
jgi:hypothetical protein